MNGITVREAALSDCEAIYRLNREEMGYDYDLEATRLRLSCILNKPGNRIFVAEQSGAVIGYVHANDYDLIYEEPLKNIMGIAVFESAKRQGAGRQLLSAVEDWAKAAGSKGVRLVSGSSRVGAHAFYQAVGYQLRKDQKNFIKFIDK